MPSPPYIVGEGVMFSGCPPAVFVCPSIHSSGQIFLPQYLMNRLSNLDETYTEYSLVPTDDLIRFCRSKVNVTSDRCKGIHVDVGALKYVF